MQESLDAHSVLGAGHSGQAGQSLSSGGLYLAPLTFREAPTLQGSMKESRVLAKSRKCPRCIRASLSGLNRREVVTPQSILPEYTCRGHRVPEPLGEWKGQEEGANVKKLERHVEGPVQT